MTQLSTPNIEAFAEVTMLKRKLQSELRDVETQLRSLEERVLNDMIEAGVQNIKVADTTVYVTEQVRAKLRGEFERGQAVDGLERAGLGDLLRVDFNLNTVSAWCREVLDSGSPLPPEFEAYFNVERGPALRVRKSS
jgi:hypothetical protein